MIIVISNSLFIFVLTLEPKANYKISTNKIGTKHLYTKRDKLMKPGQQ
jgi:hypothetical protein